MITTIFVILTILILVGFCVYRIFWWEIYELCGDLINKDSNLRIWIRYYLGRSSKAEKKLIKLQIDTKNSVKNYLKSVISDPVFKERLEHSLVRAKDRYYSELSSTDCAAIVALIQNNKAKFVERRSKTASVWDLNYQSKFYRVIYDNNRKMISTFLPDPNPRLQTVLTKEKMKEIKQFLKLEKEGSITASVAKESHKKYRKFWKWDLMAKNI